MLISSLIRRIATTTTTSTRMAPLKTPKGMRDIWPACQREDIIQTIARIFRSHGAQSLDTPVCELTETLTNKYGEDSKLIYDLKDQGGEALSLRYDLTVPFARYLAQNKIQAVTRYHIGKVYRRDNPSITKGRFREFYQCDIDFAGKFDNMMADAKCLKILCEILHKVLPYGFTIKVNHRLVLSGIFQTCGVPPELFKPICSSIDKLDKMSWEEVKEEMCKVKKLDEQVADKINSFVTRFGNATLIDQLLEEELGQNPDAKKGLEDMKVLYKHIEMLNIGEHVKFDLSLARGLDYYTGLIFEAVIDKGDLEVGSIAAGGRYDNLVSDLMDNQNFRVPIVGLSVGIERLFACLESTKTSNFHCAIGSIGGEEALSERYKIAETLRGRGLMIKDVLKVNVKPLVLYQTCEEESIPYAVFFGARDLKENLVCLRNMKTREDEKVQIDQLASKLAAYLNLVAS